MVMNWCLRAALVVTFLTVGVLLQGCGSSDPGSAYSLAVPPCRKQTDLVTLHVPVAQGSKTTQQMVMIFGGEGYDYVLKNVSKTNGTHTTWRKKNQFLNDTWLFDLNKGHWHKPELSDGVSPGRRWKGMSASINNGREYVLFGGCDTDDAKGVMDDLWVFTPLSPNQGRWRQVRTENPPPARRGHIVVTTSTHLVVFGGKGENANRTGHICLLDLWTLPLTSLSEAAALTGPASRWSRGSSFPGVGRWGATGSVVTRGGREVLVSFGGRMKDEKTGNYLYFPEVWLYDFANDSWDLANTNLSPTPRDHHGATVLDNEVYIFGGRVKDKTTADAALSDVWSFSPSEGLWTLRALNGTIGKAPQQRFGFGVDALTFKGRPVLAVFGGETLPGGPKKSVSNDLWMFDPRNAKWHSLSSNNCAREALHPDGSDSELDLLALAV